MKIPGLTGMPPAATSFGMNSKGRKTGRSGLGVIGAGAVLMGGALALSACISVNAPDKPIVIELNINIKQEVVYRLDAGVQDLIEDNEDIF